ncbi:MAG: guanylate kinase [Christensenellaceae bacterium]|nr:guanylate kinase [Christensenellaceae bacterium]
MEETRKGMLLVVSGASGTGKGTLVSRLLKEDPSFVFSVSATTRAPREGEVDGVHYHFLTEAQYDELLAKDAFLEHATVHANRYGTLKEEVYSRMEQGQNVLLDIDTQGAFNVMAAAPDCVSVFILPPSYAELKRRLEGRNTERPEDIERRFANARQEIPLMDRYQYIIVNDDLDAAYAQLRAITLAEKQRSNRYFPVVPEA